MGNLMYVPMYWVWAILIIIFAVVEGMTFGLISIWFALGAIVALITSFLGVPILIQVIVFISASGIMLVFTKPIAKDFLKIGGEKTNVESLIGASGHVIKEIEEFATGQVKVNGQIWTALEEDSSPIEVNAEVLVVAVEGVKLIVKRK
jgi:membrane protein implicated in regulation of membrane protease activity